MIRTGLAFLIGITCVATAPEADIVTGEIANKLDAYLKRLEANGFSGAIMATGPEFNLVRGYGFADREANLPVSTHTVFDIGSLTKQFTAAAIMKLWDEGKLQPGDTIDQYFENVPEDKRLMTIHHLLTHTAGMRDVFGGDYEVMERDEFVKRALEGSLKRPVGERYMYSNAGYSLLGAIIEKVSGMGFEEYLRKSFFEPLNMAQTGYVLPQWDKSKLAVGYVEGKRWGTPMDHLWADDGPYWNLRCNGGILSTVADMSTWHAALSTDRVLSERARERMFTPFADEGGGRSHYGYGWSVVKSSYGGTLITHNGGNGIFFADCYRYIDNDVFVVVMTNAAEEFDDRVVPLLAICYGKETELPPLDPPAWKTDTAR